MRCLNHLGFGFLAGFHRKGVVCREGVFPGQGVVLQIPDGFLDVPAAAGGHAEPDPAAAAFPCQAPASCRPGPDPHPAGCGVFGQGGQRLVEHCGVV